MDAADVTVDYVRDCLFHLYDYNFLHEHPLVRMLIPQVQGNTSRVQAFQQMILASIESIKPFDQSGTETKNSRLYNILSLRYQHKYQVQYVLRQLNLGERQYYRDHTKAVQALAQILNELLKENSTAPVSSGNPLSVQTELERVQRQTTSPTTDAEVFLRQTLNAIRILSDRQQSIVTSHCMDRILPETLDQTLIRQVIIWVASQLLMQAPMGSNFEVAYRTTEQTVQFSFISQPGMGTEHLSALLDGQHATLVMLLNTLDARLYQTSTQASNSDIVFEIPFQQRSMLIVDDNPDTIALFRQFSVSHTYNVCAVHDGMQAIALAQKMHPEVIILDVLLPNHDGWEILQRLKSHPSTMNTPIIICSVLDTADLALMLGADAFILKPPQELVFFNTLRHVSQRSTI